MSRVTYRVHAEVVGHRNLVEVHQNRVEERLRIQVEELLRILAEDLRNRVVGHRILAGEIDHLEEVELDDEHQDLEEVAVEAGQILRQC